MRRRRSSARQDVKTLQAMKTGRAAALRFASRGAILGQGQSSPMDRARPLRLRSRRSVPRSPTTSLDLEGDPATVGQKRPARTRRRTRQRWSEVLGAGGSESAGSKAWLAEGARRALGPFGSDADVSQGSGAPFVATRSA